MCTVSFVRLKNSVVLTSNRDEHQSRKNAEAPSFHLEKGKKIIFPKDSKAGGTWFAARENARVGVLLNGAFVNHIAKPPYQRSRGLVLLDIIEADDVVNYFKELDLENIEPFTVVLYQADILFEFRWDGMKKYSKKLDVQKNYIWASATLYSPEVIAFREKLFSRFIDSNPVITAEKVFDFHTDNHGDIENGFIIDRATGMKTFSVTQAVITDSSVNFLHTDLLQNKQYEETMPVKTTNNLS